MSKNAETINFARRIAGLGFQVYIAKDGAANYGFITDDTHARVLSFSFSDGSSLSGNYGPPSQESGTGWRMDKIPHDLQTREDVREALWSAPPAWTAWRDRDRGWKHLSSVAAYLAAYQQSSRFAKFEEGEKV